MKAWFKMVLLVVFWSNGALAMTHEFEVTIEEKVIMVGDNVPIKVFAFNGQVPGPLIHAIEGDSLVAKFKNKTSMPHSIHWHGINQQNNWKMDGVHGVTQEDVIKPGEEKIYRFTADRVGTLWYHCHVNPWEHVAMRGMWGPLIIEPKVKTKIEKSVTKDLLLMLGAWESKNGMTYGVGGTVRDEADVFTVNAKSFPNTQPIRVRRGDVIRLRFFGVGDEFHQMHLHGHDMLVTHKDGYRLSNPYYVDTLSVGPGERYDVIVKMNNPGRWMMHDHLEKHIVSTKYMMSGPLTIIEYAEIPMDDWYLWSKKEYQPDFFYEESMKKLGLSNNKLFKGVNIQEVVLEEQTVEKSVEAGHSHH